MIWQTSEQRAQAYHEYARRAHPLEMWQALHHKARFYRVDLCPDQGQSQIGIEISGETCCYPASTQGMRQAINDIEYAFHNDIL